MQQLQNASDARPETCARAVLEAVMEVMVTVREKTARRHRGTQRGPTLVHFRALGVLRKRPGSTLSMLADQLALTLSATSRLVDCLVDKGWVRRSVPDENRRTVSLVLTRPGERLLEKAIQETQQELALPLRQLSARERTALCGAMGLLRQVMESDSFPPPRKRTPSSAPARAHAQR